MARSVRKAVTPIFIPVAGAVGPVSGNGWVDPTRSTDCRWPGRTPHRFRRWLRRRDRETPGRRRRKQADSSRSRFRPYRPTTAGTPAQFPPPGAGRDVVVDQTGRLHGGVTGGGAHETKPQATQVFAHGRRDGRGGGQVAQGGPGVVDGGAVD